MYWVAIYPLDQIKSAMATDSIIVSERKYPTMAVTAQVSFDGCMLCAQKAIGECRGRKRLLNNYLQPAEFLQGVALLQQCLQDQTW